MPRLAAIIVEHCRPTIVLLSVTALVVFLSGSLTLLAAEDGPVEFFTSYCVDCHNADVTSGGIRLDNADRRDWAEHETSLYFQRALKVLRSGKMPPVEEQQPPDSQRDTVINWLHDTLMRHSQSESTVLRRLNRSEYENSIREMFGMEFEVPLGFPPDSKAHGFDNIGEGLVLSAPLMEAYFQSAILVADSVFPPPAKPTPSSEAHMGPTDLVISYSSGLVVGDAMRLAAKSEPLWRSSTWATKYEVTTPGKYRIRVNASRFAPPGLMPPFPDPMRLQIRARSLNERDGSSVSEQRLLAEFDVTQESPDDFECVVELYRAETPIFYFANALVDGDSDEEDAASFAALLRDMFKRDPRLLAGWLTVEHGRGLRGGVGWDRVKAIRDSEDLDLSQVDMSEEAVDELVKKMKGNDYTETVVYQFFEEGPALEIHDIEIEGPLEIVEGPQDRIQRKIAERFLGERKSKKDNAYIKSVMRRFLTNAFRRPATKSEINEYAGLVREHIAAGHTLEEGLHLAIRTALMSPYFLYRGHSPGKLNDFDLAARLSYFLTDRPPDKKLFKSAKRGQLSNPDKLKQQARRLLKSDEVGTFISNFTGQWLGTRELADIMPDARLLDFTLEDREAMIAETEQFFAEILSKNLPLSTFIAPDFTFMNKRLAETIYDREDIEHDDIQRVALRENDLYGGILGQASVMMATANGVDTQPVLRGVWVLENILGDPPPPPPEGVPAITPDTRGAKTVRDLLSAHRADDNCASCHRKIDPLGFVLENFDPVGRWRTHYPLHATDDDGKPVTKDGAPIDATGTFSGDIEFKSIHDLRRHVVGNIDQFANCLAEKLLTYATGRPMSYADKQEIQQIVARNLKEDGGFQDLLIALICSETFGTK